jgi:hypothetical protein
MRGCWLIILFFFSCSRKIIQKPKEIAKLDSPGDESNVLSIVSDPQNYDHTGPWIWFGMVIGLVFFISLFSLIFKK